MKHIADAIGAQLALLRAQIEVAKGNWSRFPAGSTKGGQFAPKGNGGGGGSFSGLASFLNAMGSGQPKQAPKGAVPHPKVDEKGKPVTVNYPSKPSDRSTWRDKNATATWTPGSKTPDILHGVPLKSWKAPVTTEGWSKVAGQNPKLDERMPFIPTPGKSIGAGVVIMEPDGRVWITKPTNEFGGYKHTFPKGTAEPGLSLQANAIKEAWEESGLKVQIVGVLGDFERTTSKARFYIARRVGGTPADMGWESQAMRLAPLKNANSLLNMGVDRSIISNVKGIKIVKAAAPAPAKAGNWQKQPRWPTGSALGGQWKAYDGNGLPLAPKIGSATNPAYAKAADAAYKAAAGGDLSVAQGILGKYQGAASDFAASGGKGINFHGKAKAAAHQYAADLIGAATTKTVSATPAASGGIPKLSSFGQTGTKPGGSNPGGMYNDAAGNLYLVKGNLQYTNGAVTLSESNDRARNEVLASKLMLAAGVGAPDMKLIDLEGKHGGDGLGVASKWMQGQAFDPNNALHVAAAQSDFAVHAWLANHDVLGAGFDNLKMVGGKAVNIDPGGAIAFRAQGLPKGEQFGKDAKEISSMRDPKINANGAKVYGSMTKAQLQASAQKLALIDDAMIKSMVDTHGPASDADKAALVEKLIARKQYIMGFVGLTAEGKDPTPVAPSVPMAPANQWVGPPVTATAAPATATAVPAKPAAGVQHMQATYTLQDGKSNKFWGVTVTGNVMVTHYGKIGTKGTTTTKTFGSDMEANAVAGKLTNEKLGKGYGYAGKNSAPQPVLDAISQAGYGASPAPKAPKKDSGPPPEDLASDDNPNVRSAQQAGDTSYGDAPPAGGMIAPPPKFAGANNGTMETMAGSLQVAANAGIAPTISKNSNSIKITVGSKQVLLKNPPATADGKAMLLYAQQAVAHVANKTAVQAKQPTPQVVAAATVGAASSAAPMAMPAKPPLNKLSSPSNPNTTLIAKVDKIDQIAADFAAGKVAKDTALGMIGEVKFGSNSYGKTAASFQQSMVAAIAGGNVDGMGNSAVNAVMPKQAPLAAKPAAPKKNPKFDPKKLSEPPSFAKWGTTGQPGPSSSAAVNQANQDAVQAILQTAKSGQISAIEALKFPVVDKSTGAVTGNVPALKHPSQWVKGYAQQAINEIDQQLNPPKVFRLDGSNPVTSLSASYPAHSGSLAGAAVKKLGYYVVLGNPGTISNKDVGITATSSAKNGKLTINTYAKQAQEQIAKMPKQQRDAVKSYTGSGYNAINGSLWTGNPTGAAKSAAQALKTLSHDIQPGTILSRKINLSGSDLADMIKAQGKILQEPAVSSTSISPDVWSGNVHFKMTVGPGVKGLYVGPGSNPDGGSLSSHGSEREMLLPPNTRMLVQSVKQQTSKDPDGFNSGSYLVEVLILPTT